MHSTAAQQAQRYARAAEVGECPSFQFRIAFVQSAEGLIVLADSSLLLLPWAVQVQRANYFALVAVFGCFLARYEGLDMNDATAFTLHVWCLTNVWHSTWHVIDSDSFALHACCLKISKSLNHLCTRGVWPEFAKADGCMPFYCLCIAFIRFFCMLLPYALIHGSCHDQATPVLHQYYTLSKISWTEVSADQPPDLPVPSRDIRRRPRAEATTQSWGDFPATLYS